MSRSKQANSNNIYQSDFLATHPTCVLLRAIFNKRGIPFIIGISGDSGSGKTTFSDGIRRLIGEDLVKTIQMDGYHKEDREKREQTGHLPLDPAINRFSLLKEHLEKIKQGKTVTIPIYNHMTGTFGKPISFSPSSVIIVEGLHALYPQFLPLLDFTIFVDPDREVKWQWKRERDMKKRGHQAEKLEAEMLAREAAYKKWIDFQKTSANVVIKIFCSKIREFARYELLSPLPKDCYKVEIILEPAAMPLPAIQLPFNLSLMFNTKCSPFLLSALPCKYWGKKVMIIHLDGMLSERTLEALEKHIVSCTGISPNETLKLSTSFRGKSGEVTATQFTQLLLTWRFLEQVNHQISQLRKTESVAI